jgi:hypothetical protein
MKLHLKATAAMFALAAWPAAAQPVQPAPNALETLGAMHHTGSTADWPEIPQTGPKADQVKQNLTKIKLPAGFHISLYALVPDAAISRSAHRASRPLWARASQKSGW